MTARGKSQKSMRCRECARPDRPLSPAFISRPRCCIPFIIGASFSSRGIPFDIFVRLARIARPAKKGKGRAMRVDANAMLHHRKSRRHVFSATRRDATRCSRLEKRTAASRRGRVKLKKKKKERKTKEKNRVSDAAPRENANEWRRRSYFPERTRKSIYIYSRALFVFDQHALSLERKFESTRDKRFDGFGNTGSYRSAITLLYCQYILYTIEF